MNRLQRALPIALGSLLLTACDQLANETRKAADQVVEEGKKTASEMIEDATTDSVGVLRQLRGEKSTEGGAQEGASGLKRGCVSSQNRQTIEPETTIAPAVNQNPASMLAKADATPPSASAPMP